MKKNLGNIAIVVILVSFISKIIGLLRDILTNGSLGLGYINDAYIISCFTIPNVIFGSVSTAISNGFVSVLSESYEKNGKEHMFKIANSIMNIMFIVSVLLSLVAWNFIPQICKFVSKPNNYDLTISLTKISIFSIIFISISGVISSILQTLEEFNEVTFVGIAMNIPIIIYVVIGSPYGIKGLAIATILGYVLTVLIQIPKLVQCGYKYNFQVNLNNYKIKNLVVIIAPIVAITVAAQINTLIQSKIIMTLQDQGNIGALDIANKLNGMIYSTFSLAISSVIFPHLSREGAKGNYNNLIDYMRVAMNCTNMIIIPASVGLFILRIPIIKILFMHGAFDERAVELTSKPLIYLTIGLMFWGIRDLFIKSFYAIQDTKTPMITGILSIIINIIFNFLLGKTMGISGISLAITLSVIFYCLFLIIDFRKKMGAIGGEKLMVTTAKIIFASLLMGLVIYFINNESSKQITSMKNQFLFLILSVILGSSIYIFLLKFLKVNEFEYMYNNLKYRMFLRNK